MRLRRDDRGQTVQDYLLGVVVMFLAVVFVFGYLPSMFDAYDSPTDTLRSDQADRAAEYLVSNYSVGDRPNVLKYREPGGINRTLSRDGGMAAGREQTALNTSTDRRLRPNVNVILVNSTVLTSRDDLIPLTDGGVPYAYGDEYNGQPAERSVRVVQLNGSSQCSPTCWLVVRVWL